MNCNALLKYIADGKLDSAFSSLYGKENINRSAERYSSAIRSFLNIYGDREDISIFSVPGRSEISGNHTDHNHGLVIAASVDLDVLVIASPEKTNKINMYNEGFGNVSVDLDTYAEPDSTLFGTSDSLIAGVVRGFINSSYKTGGFSAYSTSSVLKGSGLSSSAAFENAVGTVLNHFYNDGTIGYVEIAKISQYAENVFFGKPCGLMDQIACASGGLVAIDFNDPSDPVVKRMTVDFSERGYKLCIVDTGGNHADLTSDYASVPYEMKSVASFFGKNFLREVDENEFYSRIADARAAVGDRAVLRAIHFFGENKRVEAQTEALEHGDLDTFFDNMLASGRSSFCYLQNVYTTSNVEEQGLSLALAVAENVLWGKGGAFRVHGGGFAGTIQAFVKDEYVDSFKASLENVFGNGKCSVLSVRTEGAVKLI